MAEVNNVKPFTSRVFAGDAAAVSAALVAAGQKAHDWSMAAQLSSGRHTGEPYGATFWKALPDEVGIVLCDLLEGATLHRPRDAQYTLILWRETLILPVKIKRRGKRDPRPRVSTSHLRRALTRVNMPAAPQVHLFMSDEDEALREFEEAASLAIDKAKFELGNIVSQVIIAAYECTQRGGLQTVEVGLGNLDELGYIEFSDSERLSTVSPLGGAKPVEAVGESWTNAAMPIATLERREEDETATGELEPVAKRSGPKNHFKPRTE